MLVCDSKGIISKDRKDLNDPKRKMAGFTNQENIKGVLFDAVEDADVFIGVSVADVLNKEMISRMKKNPVIFALSNPEPEVKPEIAKRCGVEIMATGRSDYPNQVNNVLVFPGIFRGALDAGAIEINTNMKLAAAKAISEIAGECLNKDYIIPKPFDRRVLPAVAVSVARAAVECGNTYGTVDLKLIEKKAKKIMETNL
jgi:malate dehydrogenase (oxaloacetate-decarboxylating)